MEVEAERVVEVAILCPGLYAMHLQRAGDTNPIDFWNKLQRHVHLCLSTKKACKSMLLRTQPNYFPKTPEFGFAGHLRI